MQELSFETISSQLRGFPFPAVDAVVAVLTGGYFPALMIAHQLDKPLGWVRVRYRNPQNEPIFTTPEVLSQGNIPAQGRVLLVDDVSVSGSSLQAAQTVLPDTLEVVTFVLKGKGADGILFPDLPGCVNWPWRQAGMRD